MIWWDFNNFDFVAFFTFMCILIVLLIAVTITAIVLSQVKKKYIKLIFNEKNTTRIFVVDMKNNMVTYFDINNIRRQRKIDLVSFYNLFHTIDIEKVKGWIFAICMKNDNVSNCIEADVLVGNKEKSYYSILKLLKYSSKEGRIYVESNILDNITPNNFIPKKSKIPYGALDKEVFAQVVNEAKSTDGYLFGIRFIHPSNNIVVDSIEEKYLSYIAKNAVFAFLKSNHRQLLNYNSNEIYLLDLNLKNKEEALTLAKNILREINKSILTHGYQDFLYANISIVANRLFYKDFDTLFDRAQMSSYELNNGTSGNIIYYERNSLFSAKVETAKFNNQINNLIENRDSIRYLYRPIIKADSGEIFGYISSLKLYDSPFDNIFEATRYASKINKSKELVATVLKNVITTYSNELINKDSFLFAPGSLIGIDNIKEAFSSFQKASVVKLVVVIQEEELSELLSVGKTITDIYSLLSSPEYSFALLLKNNGLSLDSSLYSSFDYFILDGELTKDIRRSNRNRLKVHSLIENLLKYKKPIIGNDLEGWVSIELMLKAGLNYVSSETISQSSDMLLPVDKKRLQKIAVMADKYK